VVFGASGGRLGSLNAKTCKLNPGFGNGGPGRCGLFSQWAVPQTTPPAIDENAVITRPHLQEEPAKGPAGDVRALDLRTGKPGEANHDVWQGDEWVDPM
jgi:quinoprotein glucose dehydrogenase